MAIMGWYIIMSYRIISSIGLWGSGGVGPTQALDYGGAGEGGISFHTQSWDLRLSFVDC